MKTKVILFLTTCVLIASQICSAKEGTYTFSVINDQKCIGCGKNYPMRLAAIHPGQDMDTHLSTRCGTNPTQLSSTENACFTYLTDYFSPHPTQDTSYYSIHFNDEEEIYASSLLLTYESRPYPKSTMLCQTYWTVIVNSDTTLPAKNSVFHIFASTGPNMERTYTYEECISPQTNEIKEFGTKPPLLQKHK